VPTSAVAAPTIANVTASWNGGSALGKLNLVPQPQPVSLSLSPTSTVGQSGGSFATVSIASPQATDTTFQVTSSNPAVASVVPVLVGDDDVVGANSAIWSAAVISAVGRR